MKISWHFVNVAVCVHNYGFTTSSLYFSEQTSSQFIFKLLCGWKKCGQRKSPSDSNREMFICLSSNWKDRRCHFYGMLFILYHFLKSILILNTCFKTKEGRQNWQPGRWLPPFLQIRVENFERLNFNYSLRPAINKFKPVTCADFILNLRR